MTQVGSLQGTLGPRALGAAIGAVLAVVVIWSAWTVAHLVDRGSGLGLEEVFGRNGIAGGQRAGQVLAWATGPIAAGIAGWVRAPRSIGHVGRNGANMGALTYVLAIAIAPIAGLPAALTPTEFGSATGEVLTLVPFLWLASGILLAPLLLVCIVAGIAWAGLLGIARGPIARTDAPPPSIVLVAALIGLLAVAWVGGLLVFGGMLNTGGASFD
jgi:hypothetical protein